MRISAHLAGGVVALAIAIAFTTVPAHATVHEIVAQWCAGQGELLPPGVTRPGSKNFAQPLRASGVALTIVDPGTQTINLTFDYSHPAVKVRKTGTIQIGVDPDSGFAILLDTIEPDPDFPAFSHCQALGV